MPENKSKMVPLHLEPFIHTLMKRAIHNKYKSINQYVRALILEDLRKRGLLVPRMLSQLVTGSPDGIAIEHNTSIPSVSTVQDTEERVSV